MILRRKGMLFGMLLFAPFIYSMEPHNLANLLKELQVPAETLWKDLIPLVVQEKTQKLIKATDSALTWLKKNKILDANGDFNPNFEVTVKTVAARDTLAKQFENTKQLLVKALQDHSNWYPDVLNLLKKAKATEMDEDLKEHVNHLVSVFDEAIDRIKVVQEKKPEQEPEKNPEPEKNLESELKAKIPRALTAMMAIANTYNPGTATPQEKQDLKVAIESLIVLMDAIQGKSNLAADFDQANADLGPTLRVLGVARAAINNNGYTYVKTHPADFNNLFI